MKIAILGTGTMASGIAQVFIQNGHQVRFYGRCQDEINWGLAVIAKNLERQVLKGKISEEDSNGMKKLLSPSLSLKDLSDVELVIEAVIEDLSLKKELFHQLDQICKPEVVFATNTSSLSITEIAAGTKRAEKVIGMHFFNPVPVLKLVEIIRGQLTSDETFDFVYNLSKDLGKVPVTVNEAPGFLVNRLLLPMVNEGISALADGVASAEDIDEAMKLGAAHPIGPLALADLIGLDVCLAIMEVLHSEFGEDKYRPHPLLRKMVRANLLGRKTGRGFFQY